MEGIQTLKGSWPWPWPSIRPYGISSCSSDRPLPIYQLSFKLKKVFVDGRTYGRTDGRTDGRADVQTDGRTDIFPLYTIRSTFGSRPNNNILAYLGSTLVGSKHQKGSSAVFAKSSILRVHTIINWLPWCMREMKPEDSIQFHNLFSHVSYLSRSLEMLLSPERLARIRDAGS